LLAKYLFKLSQNLDLTGEESLIWNEVIVGVNFAICSTIPWRKGKVTQSLMWSGFLMKNLAKIFTGLTIQLIKLNCLPLVRISVDLVDCVLSVFDWRTIAPYNLRIFGRMGTSAMFVKLQIIAEASGLVTSVAKTSQIY
jgi:hypothetical protein